MLGERVFTSVVDLTEEDRDALEFGSPSLVSVCSTLEATTVEMESHHVDLVDLTTLTPPSSSRPTIVHLREENDAYPSDPKPLKTDDQKSPDKKLSNTLEDQKQEIDLLRRQMESEKTTIRNLEDLLTANKESEFALGLAVQEKEGEIQLFKERLALSESKCCSQQREIQSLRTRAGTSEAELERSRKQLTSERFEKERAEAEVKRLRQNANARYASPTRKSREQ
ncbi:testis-specific gene 10 protein-like [Symsagittifera roscoffensis]|uniref:testis-specific gene 10 protein-like n=1 Tax=Symsagittifera roscoffensis TaxID=84072 RepID=UPI00307CC2AD